MIIRDQITVLTSENEELHNALHTEMFEHIKHSGGVRYCDFCSHKVMIGPDGKMLLRYKDEKEKTD